MERFSITELGPNDTVWTTYDEFEKTVVRVYCTQRRVIIQDPTTGAYDYVPFRSIRRVLQTRKDKTELFNLRHRKLTPEERKDPNFETEDQKISRLDLHSMTPLQEYLLAGRHTPGRRKEEPKPNKEIKVWGRKSKKEV